VSESRNREPALLGVDPEVGGACIRDDVELLGRSSDFDLSNILSIMVVLDRDHGVVRS